MAGAARPPPIEVVALLASAGGLDALSVVLRDLPTTFSAAVVVQQHLGGDTSVLPAILGRRTERQVSWAVDGQLLTPGQVVVCPPGVDMELMPDGSCRLRRLEGIGVRRFDVLLASIARSYGGRGLAAVLSGSGRDGAEGTAAMKRSGGVVVAQSPDTAAYPSMPIAAAKAGADLVVPIHEIGRVLSDIAAGAPLPPPRVQSNAAQVLFAGPGEIRALLRETDWTATRLGPTTEWSTELRFMLHTALASGHPIAVWWGQDKVHLIEDADAPSREGARRDPLVQHLRTSARSRRTVTETNTVGVLFFRIDATIVAVNDDFVRLSGYQHDMLTGPVRCVDLAGGQFRAATSAVLGSKSLTGSPAPYREDTPWHEEWALCSPMVVQDSASTAHSCEEAPATTSDKLLDARREGQFRALLRAVGPIAGRTDAKGAVVDSPWWQDFIGPRVDEWIGWGLVNAAHTVDPPSPPPAHAVESAGARAQVAARRAAELRRRRRDLAAGFGATEQTVATARCRAAQSLRRAQLANRVAAEHAGLRRG